MKSPWFGLTCWTVWTGVCGSRVSGMHPLAESRCCSSVTCFSCLQWRREISSWCCVRWGTRRITSSARRSSLTLLCVAVLLTRVFRQSDPAFVGMLNKVREGKDLALVLAAINEACHYGEDVSRDDLVLTTTNRAADQRNRIELDRLSGQRRTYTGAIEGTFKFENDRLPSPMDLVLKSSARVMFTKNDDQKRWVNGTTGRVVELKTKASGSNWTIPARMSSRSSPLAAGAVQV